MTHRAALLSSLALLLAAAGCGPSTDCDADTPGEQSLVELWEDADADGYTTADAQEVCVGDALPAGFGDRPTEVDCDDTSAAVFPGAPDIPDDGIDQDCDGEDAAPTTADEVYVDALDPDCQDERPGTIDAPNCTMEKSSPMITPGGTMRVAQGEYTFERVLPGRHMIGGHDPSTWTVDPEVPTVMRQPRFTGQQGFPITAFVLRGDSGGVDETFIEGFRMEGSENTPISSALAMSIGGSVTVRGCTLNANGHEIDPRLGGFSVGILVGGGSLHVVDSVIDAGGGPTCTGVRMDGGDLTLDNVRIIGCDNDGDGFGADIADGSMILSDVEIALDPASTRRDGIRATATGRVFLTGSVVRASGDPATAVSISGPSARIEIKNSALLGVLDGASSTVSVRVEDGAKVLAANSLFHGGSSTSGPTAAFDVVQGQATVVNSLVHAGVSGSEDPAAAMRVGARVELSLVANNYWGDPESLLVAGAATITELVELDACVWAGCVEASQSRAEDPLFESWEEGSFRLRADSSLVDAGTDPSPYGLVVERDIEGRPVPSDGDGDSVPMWDIGPHER